MPCFPHDETILPTTAAFHPFRSCQSIAFYCHDEVDMDHVGRTPTHHIPNLLPHLVPFYLLNQITFASNPNTSAHLRSRVNWWINSFETGKARLEAVSTFLGSIMSLEKEGAPPRISWEVMQQSLEKELWRPDFASAEGFKIAHDYDNLFLRTIEKQGDESWNGVSIVLVIAL